MFPQLASRPALLSPARLLRAEPGRRRRRRSWPWLGTALVTMVAAVTGCGPLAPAVDAALGDTGVVVNSCCRDLDLAQFAVLAAGPVTQVDPAIGTLTGSDYVIRVEAVAIRSTPLATAASPSVTWDEEDYNGVPGVADPGQDEDLVLALVRYVGPAPAATGADAAEPTPTGAAPSTDTVTSSFEVDHVNPRTNRARFRHGWELFAGEERPLPDETGGKPATVVLVVNAARDKDVSLSARWDDPATVVHLSLRTGQRRTIVPAAPASAPASPAAGQSPTSGPAAGATSASPT